MSKDQPDLLTSASIVPKPARTLLQVLVPERVGDKPQLPSHASLKGTAKKYTLDACLDGNVSQVCFTCQLCVHRIHFLSDSPTLASIMLQLQIHDDCSVFSVCVQESVAMVCNVNDLVDGALQGFAVTVFAFGQTGSVRVSD